MSARQKPISIAESISPVPVEPLADVTAWHLETLRQRHAAADAGRFASTDEVQAVLRKFIRDE